MYHIYDKSLLACVIPSITTTALIGNLVRFLLSLGFLILVYLVVIGCGLTNQLRNLRTPADISTGNAWSTACFCVSLL